MSKTTSPPKVQLSEVAEIDRRNREAFNSLDDSKPGRSELYTMLSAFVRHEHKPTFEEFMNEAMRVCRYEDNGYFRLDVFIETNRDKAFKRATKSKDDKNGTRDPRRSNVVSEAPVKSVYSKDVMSKDVMSKDILMSKDLFTPKDSQDSKTDKKHDKQKDKIRELEKLIEIIKELPAVKNMTDSEKLSLILKHEEVKYLFLEKQPTVVEKATVKK